MPRPSHLVLFSFLLVGTLFQPAFSGILLSDSTNNCVNHVEEPGRALFCCTSTCFDGTTLGQPGLCQHWTSFCIDAPPNPPQCAPNQWMKFQQNLPVNDKTAGNCYLDICQWQHSSWTWSCCDCPEGFIGASKGKCEPELLAIYKYNGCIRCHNGEVLVDDANSGFQCLASSCFDQVTTAACDFYQNCVESKYPCGPNGYVESFGRPFCQLLVNQNASFSPGGQDWTSRTRLCLQQAYVPMLGNSTNYRCENITQIALDSHTKCYTDSGLCKDLPAKDLGRLLCLVYEELGNQTSAWQQLWSVAVGCGAQYYQATQGAVVDFIFTQQLQNLLNVHGSTANIMYKFYTDYIRPYFPPLGIPTVTKYDVLPWSVEAGPTKFRVVFLADNTDTASGVAQAMTLAYQNAAPNGQPFGSLQITFQSSVISLIPALPPPTQTPTRAPVAPTSKPTASPAVSIKIPKGYCFSGVNTVEVEGKGVIQLKDLKIGDLVKDSDGKMARVYSFGHYQPQTRADFIALSVRGPGAATTLEVSRDHLVFVDGAAIPASQIVVGDRLSLCSYRSNCSNKVTKIKWVSRTGVYAPFTMSGTINVSGVAASCYVTLQTGSSVLTTGNNKFKTWLSMHWLCHMFQSSHRLVCLWNMAYCEAEQYTEDGISHWAERPLQLGQWLTQQNGVVMASIFIPSLALGMVVHSFEILFTCNMLLLLFCGAISWASLYSLGREARETKLKSKII